ncbi:MAG: response regulator [Acholeplasmataceae bacterium]|nr:response regulator [Acholeplasmataceae bacterium]
MDKVLIVLRRDCNELAKQYISRKFDVEVCCDVVEALQKIKITNYKMVILDMGSNRICGMDLLRIIRTNPCNHHLKIIVTAKNYNYKYIQESFKQGADFFIKLPFKIEEIETLYDNLKQFDDYVDLEAIAKYNKFNWLSEI